MDKHLVPPDTENQATPPNIPQQPQPRLWWRRLIMLVLLLWVVNVTWIAQIAGWGGELFSWDAPWFNESVWASLVQGLLLIVPLLIASRLWKMVRYRAMATIWLAASGLGILLALTRLWPSTHPQWMLLVQVILIFIYGRILTRRFTKTDIGERAATDWKGLPLALTVSALLAFPWLVVGSLGSPLDLVLNLLIGLLIGWVANLLINRIWLSSLVYDSRGLGRDGLTGGFVVGTTLLILVSGLSLSGLQLLLMLTLPTAGWVLMATSDFAAPHLAGSALGPGWVVGLLCGVILNFTDTDATVLQALDPLLTHYSTAAGFGVVLALLLGLLALITRYRVDQWRNSPTVMLLGIALWLVGALTYHVAGQPGLHGDRLFVVMETQADVSSAEAMPNYDERRGFVYQTLVVHAQTSQMDLRASLDRFGIEYTPYYLVNALEVEGGILVRLWLSIRSDVDRIMPSPHLRPLYEAQTPASGEENAPNAPQWNLTNLGADRVWEEFGVTGQGIVIGQSDSGIQHDHPEVADSYRGSDDNHDYSWFDPWGGLLQPNDIGGHGTHTLGSVLGNTVGVAPDAEWIGCANLYRNMGNPAFYLDCMQFMLAPFPIGGNPFTDGNPHQSAHVLNNSWGCPESFEGCDPESLRPAARSLRAAGIFVVASAGNSGPACSSIADSIAIYDEVFTVGAVNEQNDLAVFSSTGPVIADGSGRVKPDIVAPGVDVLSAYPNSTYEKASGTSMAGPHVAGVVALVWSANPALIGNIERTEEILIETAIPFSGTLEMPSLEDLLGLEEDEDVPDLFKGFFAAEPPAEACIRQADLEALPNNVAGFGVVDAYGAVRMALGE